MGSRRLRLPLLRRFGVAGGGLGGIRRRSFDKLRTGLDKLRAAAKRAGWANLRRAENHGTRACLNDVLMTLRRCPDTNLDSAPLMQPIGGGGMGGLGEIFLAAGGSRGLRALNSYLSGRNTRRS